MTVPARRQQPRAIRTTVVEGNLGKSVIADCPEGGVGGAAINPNQNLEQARRIAADEARARCPKRDECPGCPIA